VVRGNVAFGVGDKDMIAEPGTLVHLPGTLPGETLGLQDMEDSFQVTCPYCGETVELFLDSEGGHRRVSVGRGDGSE
jgi:hypothetical protein